jgi:hypothetical protein
VKELHVTSPLMAGPAVLEAQQKLRALGYAPGKLDGQYGPATAGFNAIEGNTGIGNDANGGEIMRRRRYLSDVNAFGRVK